MEKRTVIITVSVIGALVVASGLGVLIWWLLWDVDEFTTIVLAGEGIGSARYTAAFTRIRNAGDMFWWFYPTTAASGPLLLWLDGVTGLPPSLLANLGMIGPYDYNFNQRNNSWVDEFNLLFVDAPLGTGYSTSVGTNGLPRNLEENADHLVFILNSFFSVHEELSDTPLYIIGQGSGAQLALALATRLSDVEFNHNLRGVVLANAIISPALTLTRLGLYLEELGYIDTRGRAAIEELSNETSTLMNQERFDKAFDRFITLGDYVNEAGAVAVNMGRIVDKLTRESSQTFKVPDYFGQRAYIRNQVPEDVFSIMDQAVAGALGISSDATYDDGRQAAVQAVRETFMIPAVDRVEHILQNTDLKLAIYNGNLDAVSNTPGQLEWVDNLRWSGQGQFRSSPRRTLAVNRVIEGYFRETNRLQFYWMNAAGHWVPMDSPAGMRRVIQRITEN